MKKLFTLFMLLCIGCMGVWAQNPTYLVQVSTIENPVEYNIANGGQKWLGSSRFATDATDAANTDKTLGRFIFIENESRDGSVYIYDTRNQKYLSWTSDASSANNNTRTASTSYVQYKDKADAKTWWITTGNASGSYYVRTSSTTSGNKWNYCGGAGYVLNLFSDSDNSASWYFVLAPKENTKYMIRNERADQSVWYLKADRLHTSNSNEAGLFTFESKGDGSYYIKNESNGYLYSTQNTKADGSHRTSETAYIQYTQTKQSATSWYITKNGENSGTSSYFDVRPTLVFTDNTPAWNFTGGQDNQPLNFWEANDGSSQWTFEEFTISTDDINSLQTKIISAYEGITSDKIGYPTKNSNNNQSAIEAMREYSTAGSINAENYINALTAYNSVIVLTDINLPKAGKAYKIAFNGSNGTKYYIQQSGNPTTNAENAAIVVVGDKGGAADAQRFYFVNSANAQWMNYQGFSNKTYTSSVHDFRVEPINKYNNTSHNNLTLSKDRSFGYVFLYATKRPNNDNHGGMVVNESNGAWSSTQYPFFNGSYTSAITFEEVEFPYTTKNLNDGGDGNYYATVALPYAMNIPEGVKAYAASATGDVLHLTEVTETSRDIHAGAYILVSNNEENHRYDIIPAAANPVEVSNELQGSITTAPFGDIYVLNKVDGVGFYKFNGDYSTLLGKAYLPSSAKVNRFVFSFDNLITAISAVESDNSKAEIFDLNGRKLTRAQKGMNIINGMKVLVK